MIKVIIVFEEFRVESIDVLKNTFTGSFTSILINYKEVSLLLVDRNFTSLNSQCSFFLIFIYHFFNNFRLILTSSHLYFYIWFLFYLWYFQKNYCFFICIFRYFDNFLFLFSILFNRYSFNEIFKIEIRWHWHETYAINYLFNTDLNVFYRNTFRKDVDYVVV